jgi:MFS family permease
MSRRRARLLADLSPLRDSADFRRLYVGQLVSFVGSQLTVVAVPYQVFLLTGSSLQVGLVSLAQFVPLLVGSLAGGAMADSMDRRRLLMVMQVLQALTSVGLAVNAGRSEPVLWPIYAFSAAAAGLSGIDRPARSAAIPGVIDRAKLPAAYALWQILIQVGLVAGPAGAGVLLEHFGLAALYWLDTLTVAAALLAVIRMAPLPPAGGGTPVGLRSVMEGLAFARRRQELVGVFAVDLDAMVFGMPRAVFPAMATQVYDGGASTYGLLSAAPGAGALLGALTTGWVGGVRRQGRAVVIAVAVWGMAVAAFGVAPWLWAGLLLLAVAGAADVISAVFRNTILQTTVPDALRGRLSALQIAVVTGGPRLGDAEAGAVASLAGARFSVVSGGLACVAGVALLAWLLPRFRDYETAEAPAPALSLLDEPPPDAGSSM